jgi:Ni/Co efflux regulator RcnB
MGYAKADGVETAMTRLLISTAFAGLLAFAGAALAQGQDDRRDRGRNQQPAPQASQPAPQAAQPAPQAAQPAPRADQPRIGGQYGRGYNPGPAAQNAPAAQPAPRGPENDRRGGFMNFGNGARGAAPAAPGGGANPGNNMRGPENDRRALGNDQRGPDNRGPDNRDFGNRGPDNRGPGNNDRRAFGNDRRGPDNNDRRIFGNDRGGPDSRRDFGAFQRNFNAPRRFRAQVYNRPRGWYPHRWTYGEILPSLFWAPDYWLTDYYDYGLEPPPPGTVWVRDGSDALLIDRFSGQIIQVAYGVFY